MRLLLPALLVLAAGCTPTARDLDRQASADAAARAGLDRELAGLVPGKPQDCVNQAELGSVHSFGDTLVYRRTGSAALVTRTSGGCPGAGDGSILITSTPTGQLCRGDIAHTIDRSSRMPNGSCSFGAFVPYNRPR